MVLFRRRIAEDELQTIYKKAESARYMRHHRNPALYTLEKFDAWRENAKVLLEKARSGEISAAELSAELSK
jgi:hypothetical protein